MTPAATAAGADRLLEAGRGAVIGEEGAIDARISGDAIDGADLAGRRRAVQDRTGTWSPPTPARHWPIPCHP